MKLILDILFLTVIGYYSIKFIQFLIKLEYNVSFPTTTEEYSMIRKHPERPLEPPIYSKQKVGIIIYAIMLIFVITMYFIGLSINEINWSVYLLLSLPLTNTSNFLNLFGIVDDGILSGNRFIAWGKIKSFEFVPIDVNHKFYGYSREANNGYELKIKTRGFPVNCVVTTDEMKEKLNDILKNNIENEQVTLEEQNE